MSTHFDFVVLGRGIAGTTLTWHLHFAGQRVLVIDREPEVSSSKIAAGLITAVTGQKLTVTWRFPEFWPTALAFYRNVERETGEEFFREVTMSRLFLSEAESSLFEQRRLAGRFEDLVTASGSRVDEHFNSPYGGFDMHIGGQLNVPRYLDASRNLLSQTHRIECLELDVSRDIVLAENHVEIPRIDSTADHLVCCQGFEAVTNPWFFDVAFKPAKGEILTLRIPHLNERRVIHQGIWLAHWQDDLFKVGSTYDWKHLDHKPTTAGRDEMLERLRGLLRLPFEIVSHHAAVRPIHRNQYPILGRHLQGKSLSIFNGLGSKGSLQAPYFARMLSNHLLSGKEIEPSVDVNRKTTWNLTGVTNQGGTRQLRQTFHVKRPNRRSLTDRAQDAILNSLRPGETAIDATAGNGHDTLFLAQSVGSEGRVFAFDIQQLALENTSARLVEHGVRNVVLFNEDHRHLAHHIPSQLQGNVAAIMFNLGYLPGGDKQLTTQPESTQLGILGAARLLRPGGLLTILVYTGHAGSEREMAIVRDSLEKLDAAEFRITRIEGESGRRSSPVLFLVKRAVPNYDPA